MAKNPSTGMKPSTEDSGPATPSTAAHMGQTVMRAFPKDSSSMQGNEADERNSRISNAPSLSHSFSGNNVAKAPSRGGN